MTKQEISQHNEALLIQKVKSAYAKGDLHGAMKLCQDLMGVDAKVAYERVRMLCEGEKKDA